MNGRRILLVTALTAAALLSGCAAETPAPDPDAPAESPGPEGSPAPGGGEDTALAQALASTPANPASTVYFAFSDLSGTDAADARGWLESIRGTPYEMTGMLGAADFAPYVSDVSAVLPNPARADATAVSIGTPPSTAARFTGVADPASALADVAGERSELGEGTLLVRRADNAVDLRDEDFPPGLTARLNVIWFDDSTVTTGTARALVEGWSTGDGESLADHYSGVTGCLGDAAAAAVVSAGHARTSGDVAVGVGREADAPVQTLCLRTADPEGTMTAAERALSTGSVSTGQTLVELVGSATVEDAGDGWVRVRTADGAPAIFTAMLMRGELALVAG